MEESSNREWNVYFSQSYMVREKSNNRSFTSNVNIRKELEQSIRLRTEHRVKPEIFQVQFKGKLPITTYT